MTVNEALLEAIKKHQAGEFQDAEKLYRAILAVDPENSDANHNLGILALDLGYTQAAIPLFEKALEANPNVEQYKDSMAKAISALNKNSEPPLADMAKLAQLFEQEAYKEAFINAVDMTNDFPNCGFAWKVLGAALDKLGNLEQALHAKEKSVMLLPEDAEAHSNLAYTLSSLGRFEEAEYNGRKATALKPDYAEAYYNLGNILSEQNKYDQAEESYIKALSLRPNYLEAHINLGNALKFQGKFTQAEESYNNAISLKSDLAELYMNLGSLLKDKGDFEKAEENFKKSISLNPAYLEAYSNLLLSYNYRYDIDYSEYLNIAKKFGEAVSSKATRKSNAQVKVKSKLRVGFISGDLREHPVGYFLENMLANIKNLEMYAYSTTRQEDALTLRIKPYFQKWVCIFKASDEEAATLIHNNEVDVLIDLSGHTAHNRLGIFGYRPARVAISWLGYFASSGVSEIDYFLSDSYVAPIGEERNFTEKIWRMPNSFLCFTPPLAAPNVSELPAVRNRYITFGCFNNLSKLNDEVIKLWAKILKLVPDSKLFLKSKQLSDEQITKQIASQFKIYDIDRHRLIFEGFSSRADYFESYSKIDIALDPFPFPGGTTTVEGIWMGVPAITLKGDRLIARQGETIAHNLGIPEWIADTKEEYLGKTIKFSADLETLAGIRANLRDMALNSPLFDGERFAKDFEDAINDIYCLNIDDKQ